MKTVVILLSDKRSGSTMFQDALCAHPNIQTVDYSPHTYLETHHWLKAAVLLGQNPSLFSNGKTYKNYGSKKNARIYLEAELKGNLPNYIIPKDDKQLVFEGWVASSLPASRHRCVFSFSTWAGVIPIATCK